MTRRPEEKDNDIKKQENAEIIQNIAEGDFLQAIVNGAKKAVNLIKAAAPQPIPFEEWLQQISDEQDREIIKCIRNLKKTEPEYAFVAGKLKISLEDTGEIVCITTMYLKSDAGQWQQYELKKTEREDRLSDWDTAPELKKLRAGETLTYDIDSPLE